MIEKIKALTGADCIWNEMRGKIVDVFPIVVDYSEDIEDSINFSKFRIRLEFGLTVTMPGSRIASIKRARS